MNKNNLKILVLAFLLFEISCNSGNSIEPAEGISVDTSYGLIDSTAIAQMFDTVGAIKGHCFILENIISSGEDQYRRLIKFDNSDNCSYKVMSAHATRMGSPGIYDGRNNGQWSIKNGIVYIQWDAYYMRKGRGDNWGEELTFKRIIEGKYKITVLNNNLSLQFISENVTSNDLDEEQPEDPITLFYNNDIEGLFYNSVNCDNVESIYMVRNFTPQKRQESNKFLEDYNKKHSCDNQRSFDAGYDLARDQIGNGLLADADYLYRLTSNEYDYYCFKKGVEQYITDKKEY
jgi:hypothetical protein